jgi:hypothetical protein
MLRQEGQRADRRRQRSAVDLVITGHDPAHGSVEWVGPPMLQAECHGGVGIVGQAGLAALQQVDGDVQRPRAARRLAHGDDLASLREKGIVRVRVAGFRQLDAPSQPLAGRLTGNPQAVGPVPFGVLDLTRVEVRRRARSASSAISSKMNDPEDRHSSSPDLFWVQMGAE